MLLFLWASSRSLLPQRRGGHFSEAGGNAAVGQPGAWTDIKFLHSRVKRVKKPRDSVGNVLETLFSGYP